MHWKGPVGDLADRPLRAPRHQIIDPDHAERESAQDRPRDQEMRSPERFDRSARSQRYGP